jgi:hypothetical protein
MEPLNKLGAIKQEINSLMDQLIQDNLTFNFTLIPFANEVIASKIIETNNPAVVKDWVNNLDPDADEGDNYDCPENSLGAVLESIERSFPKGDIWLITDDIPLSTTSHMPKMLTQLLLNRKKLHTILYPPSCSSEQDAAPFYSLYALASKLTGGQSFRFLDPNDTEEVVRTLLNEAKTSSQIAFVSEQLNAVGRVTSLDSSSVQYTVPIDGTASEANFLFNVLSEVMSFQVFYPDDTLVQPGDPGTTFIDIGSSRYVQIVDPVSGQWAVAVSGQGEFVLSVSADSNIDFRRLTPNVTAINQEAKVTAFLAGPIASVSFELVRADGTSVTPLQLSDDGTGVDLTAGDGIYSGLFMFSEAGDFQLRVTGQTVAGDTYVRTDSAKIHVQGLHIIAPPNQMTLPGETVSYVFTVVNPTSQTMNIQVDAESSEGWSLSGVPYILGIPPQGQVDVNVNLSVPADAIDGALDQITFVATRLETQAQLPEEVAFARVRTGLVYLVAEPLTSVYLPLILNGSDSVSFATTVYSQLADGEVLKVGCATWMGCRGATSGNGAYTGFSGATVDSTYNSGEYFIKRVFLYFDTSTLPVDATIHSAILHLYAGPWHNGSVRRVHAVKSTQAEPLSVSDFSRVSFISGGFADLVANTWIQIPLNTTGQTWVVKGGTTKIALIHDLDLNNVVPNEVNNSIISMAEDSAHQPYLRIQYSMP